MIKRLVVLTTTLPLLWMLHSTAATAQSLSQRVSEQLVESASQQLNADLHIGQLQVNGLTDELSAHDIRLATRVKALSEPLNQLIIADQIRLAGDWQVLGQRQVSIQQIALTGAQLTVAYYGTGQSNLHQLLAQLKQLQGVTYQPAASSTPVKWALQELSFSDVTINLFDRGEPIASVNVPSFVITDIDSAASSDQAVKALLFPIVEQLLRQWREGSSSGAQNVQIDGPALTRFLMREALAF